jgi:hypothetical protein
VTNYTKKQQKIKLEKAIEDALNIAHNEWCVLKDYYMEENLRYVVMTEISKAQCFGDFPNKNINGNLLCFEQSYPKHKSGHKSFFKPDIVSIKLRKNGASKYSINKVNPLIIELKQNASLGKIKSPPKPDLFEPNPKKQKIGPTEIKEMSSSLSTDIFKVRQYLEEIDNIRFEFGVVIIVGTEKEFNFSYLQEILVLHQNELKDDAGLNKNLLFAWFNPRMNKPELIWLNQKEKIKLGGY